MNRDYKESLALRAEIKEKILAEGQGAPEKWVVTVTSAMSGNQKAKAACEELIGRPIESMLDLWNIQSAAYDAASKGEQALLNAQAEQNAKAMHDTTNDANAYLANRLASLRKAAGLTQKELAHKANMPIVTIQKLENGANKLLRARTETTLALSRALGITVEELTNTDQNE